MRCCSTVNVNECAIALEVLRIDEFDIWYELNLCLELRMRECGTFAIDGDNTDEKVFLFA